MYVSIEEDNELAAYDVASKKRLFGVKTGGEPEGVLADGKTAYVTSRCNLPYYLVLDKCLQFFVSEVVKV